MKPIIEKRFVVWKPLLLGASLIAFIFTACETGDSDSSGSDRTPLDRVSEVCDEDDPEQTGGITAVIDAEEEAELAAAGMVHDLSSPLALSGVRVTFINDAGTSQGFFVQKSRNCPGIQIFTGSASPTSGLTLPGGGTGVGLGDLLDISVSKTSTFSGNEQVAGSDSGGYTITAWEDGDTADLDAIATDLADESSLDGIKGRLITYDGSITSSEAAGGGTTLTIGDNDFDAYTGGLSGSFCAGGSFELTYGAVVTAFNDDLQIRLFTPSQIKNVVTNCPLSACEGDSADDGGILAVINAQAEGTSEHSPALELEDVRVTFINDAGASQGFYVQKSRNCPGIQIFTGSASPTSGLTLPGGGAGVGLGDLLDISVSKTSTFSGNEQVTSDGYTITDWTDGNAADIASLATDLAGRGSLDGLKGYLVDYDGNITSSAAAGGSTTLTIGGNDFDAYTQGLSSNLFCDGGSFTLNNGAVVTAFNDDLQIRLFTDGQITVVDDMCPEAMPADSVIITRWTYGKGTDSLREFVELANPTDSAVDVGGWTLRAGAAADDCTGGNTQYSFPASTMLPSESYYLLTSSDYESNKSGDDRLGSADPAPAGDGQLATMTTDDDIDGNDDIYLCDSSATDGAATEIDRSFGSLGNSSGRAAERMFDATLGDDGNYIDTDTSSDWTESDDENDYTILSSATTEWAPPSVSVEEPTGVTCDSDSADDGGILAVINAEAGGTSAHSPALVLTDVTVTFINDVSGSSFKGFYVQKSKECPGIQILTGSTDPASGSLEGISGGVSVGDTLTIEVSATSTFRGNEQVTSSGYSITAQTDGGIGDDNGVAACKAVKDIAIRLSDLTNLDGLKGRLVRYAPSAGQCEVPGFFNVAMDGGNAGDSDPVEVIPSMHPGRMFDLYTGDLTEDLFCEGGSFTLPAGAVVTANNDDLQLRLFSDAQVDVTSDNCPEADHIIISRWADGGESDPIAFVELANPTDSAVNIAGWSIRKGTGTDGCSGGTEIASFPPTGSSLSISSKSYYLVTTSGYGDNTTGEDRLGMATTAPPGDINFGVTARLDAGIGDDKDVYLCNDSVSGDTEVDRAPAGNDLTGYMAGYAVQRSLNDDMDNYIDTDETDDWGVSSGRNDYNIFNGASCSAEGVTWPVCVAAMTPSISLVINEVDYDQSGADTAEFIEIYNTGSSAVDLTGMKVELINGSNDSVYGTATLSGNLAAGAYLVVTATGSGSSTLGTLPAGTLTAILDSSSIQNGEPDAVRLVTSGDALIDAVTYEGSSGIPGASEGDPAPADTGDGSIARCPNGMDTDDNSVDFKLANAPTPGASNEPQCPTG